MDVKAERWEREASPGDEPEVLAVALPAPVAAEVRRLSITSDRSVSWLLRRMVYRELQVPADLYEPCQRHSEPPA